MPAYRRQPFGRYTKGTPVWLLREFAWPGWTAVWPNLLATLIWVPLAATHHVIVRRNQKRLHAMLTRLHHHHGITEDT